MTALERLLSEIKRINNSPENVHCKNTEKLLAIVEVARQDLTSISNIDHGKLKNFALACLSDIERLAGE